LLGKETAILPMPSQFLLSYSIQKSRYLTIFQNNRGDFNQDFDFFFGFPTFFGLSITEET
jgi:hypothetical protein